MKKISLPLLIFTLLLAACASSANLPATEAPYQVSSQDAGSGFAPQAAPQDKALSESIAANSAAPAVERMVIQNVNLTLTVADPQASLNALSALAEKLGGYVVSTNLYETYLENGARAPRGELLLRVPQEKLEEALAQIKQNAIEVTAENRSGQDVTGEYTDLASRLRNLENAEKQLSEIMSQAKTADETLNVFNQLTSIREQIEVIKGQMQYYEQSVALSAINLSLVAEASLQPLQIGGWRPQGTAREALQLLINFLKGFGDFLIFLVIFIIPAGALIFGLLALLWRGLRWLWRKFFPKKARPLAEKPVERA